MSLGLSVTFQSKYVILMKALGTMHSAILQFQLEVFFQMDFLKFSDGFDL